MHVGVSLEIKSGEARVGLTPQGVRQLVANGHRVSVQSKAGAAVGFSDADYVASGAQIATHAAGVWAADLVVKVKELQPSEYGLPRAGQVIFGFQQFAPDPGLLAAALASGADFLAYETVEDEHGALPLLAPMSRIAGCLAPQIGAWALQRGVADRRDASLMGSGVLLPSTCGLPAGKVVIVGAGQSGSEAARIASGLGADVRVFARTSGRFAALLQACAGPVRCDVFDNSAFEDAIRQADLVIGAVLTPGRLSPKLISAAMLEAMRPGSVLVDIGIDQGGIAVSSHPTTHANPLYLAHGVLHYCVPNIPALVARTATLALTAATLPYVLKLVDEGLDHAIRVDAGLARGLQVRRGSIVDERLAQDTKRL